MIEAEAGLPKASGRDRGAVARRVPRVTAVNDDLLTVPMDDDLERQSRLRDGAPKPWGKASSSTG